MNYDETDDIIAKKYWNAEPHFDAEGVWSALEPRLRKKKRRSLLWLFMGISFMVFMAFLLIWTKNVEAGGDVAANKMAKDQSKQEKVLAQLGNNSNEPQEVIFTQEEEYLKDKSLYSIEEHPNPKKSTSLIMNVNLSPDLSLKSKIDDEALEVVQSISKSTDNDSEMESELSTILSKGDNFDRQLKEVLESQETLSIEYIQSLTTSLEFVRSPLLMDGVISFREMYPSNKKNRYTFGIFGGYFLHSRSLEHAGGVNFDTYNSRTAEEEALDAFDLGIRINYDLSDHWGMFGGLRYSTAFVGRMADYVYLETITIPEYTVRIIQTDEGVVEEKETLMYDGYYQHRSNNYLQSKRLGFLGGVEYRLGEGRLSSILNLGLEVPLWTDHSGIITHEGRPYNLASESIDIHNPQVLVYTAFGVRYELVDGVGLQGSITGFLPLQNEYNPSYQINKKSTLLGANLEIQIGL
ncbi:MAG: hypothetical protein AAGA77_16655 [Bacteroidota bacterium]